MARYCELCTNQQIFQHWEPHLTTLAVNFSENLQVVHDIPNRHRAIRLSLTFPVICTSYRSDKATITFHYSLGPGVLLLVQVSQVSQVLQVSFPADKWPFRIFHCRLPRASHETVWLSTSLDSCAHFLLMRNEIAHHFLPCSALLVHSNSFKKGAEGKLFTSLDSTPHPSRKSPILTHISHIHPHQIRRRSPWSQLQAKERPFRAAKPIATVF